MSIEKHFSFDRGLWGSDHKVSVTPKEFKDMVDAIRKKEYLNVDETPFYGNIKKEFEGAKNEFRSFFKKTLVAARDISEGTVITKDMIYAMRPQIHLKGLPSEKFEEIIGKRASIDIKKFDPLHHGLLE